MHKQQQPTNHQTSKQTEDNNQTKRQHWKPSDTTTAKQKQKHRQKTNTTKHATKIHKLTNN